MSEPTNDGDVVTDGTTDVPATDDKEYTTVKGTLITVRDGRTYAVDCRGSETSVDGDVFDTVVAAATLLSL